MMPCGFGLGNPVYRRVSERARRDQVLPPARDGLRSKPGRGARRGWRLGVSAADRAVFYPQLPLKQLLEEQGLPFFVELDQLQLLAVDQGI